MSWKTRLPYFLCAGLAAWLFALVVIPGQWLLQFAVGFLFGAAFDRIGRFIEGVR